MTGTAVDQLWKGCLRLRANLKLEIVSFGFDMLEKRDDSESWRASRGPENRKLVTR